MLIPLNSQEYSFWTLADGTCIISAITNSYIISRFYYAAIIGSMVVCQVMFLSINSFIKKIATEDPWRPFSWEKRRVVTGNPTRRAILLYRPPTLKRSSRFSGITCKWLSIPGCLIPQSWPYMHVASRALRMCSAILPIIRGNFIFISKYIYWNKVCKVFFYNSSIWKEPAPYQNGTESCCAAKVI